MYLHVCCRDPYDYTQLEQADEELFVERVFVTEEQAEERDDFEL
jgi:hypothetical protein